MRARALLIGGLLAGAICSGPGCGDGSESDDRPLKADGERSPRAVPGGQVDEQSGTPKASSAKLAAPANSAPQLAREPEHRAFNLLDNRHLAHRQRNGGLLIEAGAAGFAKYVKVRFAGMRWKHARQGDVAVARPKRGARLDVPLTEAQAGTATAIWLHVYSPEKRSLKVAINRSLKDKKVGSVSVAVGWSTVEVPVEPGTLSAGTNTIGLRHSHGSPFSVQWIQIGGEPPGDTEVEPLQGDAPSLRRGEALVYYVFVPPAATLRGSIGGDGCGIAASAANHAGAASEGALPGRVDLTSVAGTVARIELRLTGCKEAALNELSMVVPGVEPTSHSAPPPKYVILWIMDTLRADRVSTANPEARADVPTLQKLAKTGAVFRQYYVEGNESQTSHSSIWTSLFPVNHGVITSGPLTHYQLSKRFSAIGPLMKDAGLRTVGVTSNGTIFGWSGYTRGFDTFNNLMKDGTGRRLGFRVPGNMVLDRAIAKVGDDVTEPMFLFIGTTDTHKPWYGHQPWLDRYDPGPYQGRFKKNVLSAQLGIPKGTHLCKWKVPPREMQRILAIYDSDISFQDEQLGRLLEQLDRWGIRDETMLIVSADHGEELWEYPVRCGHGSTLRQSLVNVPLLIHYPPLIPQTVVETGADGVDLLPTILAALGREPLDAAQGESLLPRLQGIARDYPRPSYASMNEWAHTMRLLTYKATVSRGGNLSLYDVSVDPFEHEELSGARPVERQFVSDAMHMFLVHRKRWKKRLWGAASNMTARAARDFDELGRARDGGNKKTKGGE